jgi:hypothetical protein
MNKKISFEKNVVKACYFMRIKAESGYGVEQIITDMVNEDFGYISLIFKDFKSFEDLEKRIDEVKIKQKEKEIIKFVDMVRCGFLDSVNFSKLVDDYLEYYMKNKELEINNYQESIQFYLNAVMIFMIVPVFMLLFNMLSTFGFSSGLQNMVNHILIVNIFVLFSFVLMMKIKEPVV